jgi:hypothetical protein
MELYIVPLAVHVLHNSQQEHRGLDRLLTTCSIPSQPLPPGAVIPGYVEGRWIAMVSLSERESQNIDLDLYNCMKLDEAEY